MRLVPAILTNVAVAGLAILVYDTVRGGDGAAPPGGGPKDASALEARLAAIEARLDGLAASRGDRAVAARIAEIETRLAAVAPVGGARTAEGASSADASAPSGGDGAGGAAAPAGSDPAAPVTDAEVARFRKVQERVDAERERERILGVLDGILARLGLNLTPEQKARLGAETVAYRAKLREAFPGGGPGFGGGPGGMGGGGRPPEEILAAVQEVQRGYVARLEEFLPAQDAAAIAAAVTPGPRGPGRGGGGEAPPPR